MKKGDIDADTYFGWRSEMYNALEKHEDRANNYGGIPFDSGDDYLKPNYDRDADIRRFKAKQKRREIDIYGSYRYGEGEGLYDYEL